LAEATIKSKGDHFDYGISSPTSYWFSALEIIRDYFKLKSVRRRHIATNLSPSKLASLVHQEEGAIAVQNKLTRKRSDTSRRKKLNMSSSVRRDSLWAKRAP
jgi:hypothetical protein